MKLLAIFAVVAVCGAQAPAFEVASVKLNRSGPGRGGFRPEPGRLTMTNVTLKGMVRFAYSVRDFQISGGPAWFDSDHWDIAATAGREITDNERKKMLQTLLEDRFQMVVRHETKELPVYALVVGKGGPKLKASTSGISERVILQAKEGVLSLTGDGVTLPKLADVLFGQVGRLVVDRTEIRGSYDFKLEFVRDSARVNGVSTDPGPDGASIFTAVQEQLGLKLESARAPVETLVIERAEKAAEN
jgi:uncharacterized protein (TIGR03435 family)